LAFLGEQMVDDFGGLESDLGTSIVTELEDGRQQ
jgi:hypothetical protein